jgi:nucleoside-diphosphate-sugar epimerase
MRVLVTGAAGMLGHRVVADARARGWDAIGVDLPDGDLTDPLAAQDLLEEHTPDAVVHCAAFVDVDGAEEHEDTALAVNADASANVAAAAAMLDARIVAVSTDYVFDGKMLGPPPPPHRTGHPPHPRHPAPTSSPTRRRRSAPTGAPSSRARPRSPATTPTTPSRAPRGCSASAARASPTRCSTPRPPATRSPS